MPLTPEELLAATPVPLAADNPSYGAPSPPYPRRYDDNRSPLMIDRPIYVLGFAPRAGR
jgi:hypothetical protein